MGEWVNKILRRFQATDLKVLKTLKDAGTLWLNLITALSVFDFGYPVLQSICRTIIVPVRGGCGCGCVCVLCVLCVLCV